MEGAYANRDGCGVEGLRVKWGLYGGGCTRPSAQRTRRQEFGYARCNLEIGDTACSGTRSRPRAHQLMHACMHRRRAVPQSMEDWLYEEGEDTTKSVYHQKLVELRLKGAPVETR